MDVGDRLLVLLLVVCSLVELCLTTQPRVLTSQPEWLKKPCRRKDPNLNQCLKDLFQGMFPYMAKGIPEVGIPRFEPLYIEKIFISKGHGAVTLAGNFDKLHAHGPSNSTTRAVRLDVDKGRLDISLHIPVIRTESKYDLRGNILLLPIVGVGDARLLLRNVTTDVYMKVVFPKLPTGQEVMAVTDMKVDFRMSNVRVHLDNLFNGNKVLGHTVNNFLNKNAMEVVDELKDNVGDALTEVFKKIMNDAFGRIPTKFWLPEDDDVSE
ncbi:protein takeout-like [Macrosteles quadrilineatus]|uniref:protein takeout-like n=1 Tax=Macrosteles quadrilineatus TaxID=74068 RepID=UPI0023E0D4E0|nr:protein takeout-like [Macrosteles quadrilineatus]XP_054270294.1 protein takeout-like [Macrosteles quadrilineatus]